MTSQEASNLSISSVKEEIERIESSIKDAAQQGKTSISIKKGISSGAKRYFEEQGFKFSYPGRGNCSIPTIKW